MSFEYTLNHLELSMKERKLPLERARSYIRNSYVDPETTLSDAQFRAEMTGQTALIAVRGGVIRVDIFEDDDTLPEERIDPPTDLPNRPL